MTPGFSVYLAPYKLVFDPYRRLIRTDTGEEITDEQAEELDRQSPIKQDPALLANLRRP